jgi:ribosomal protein S18 acetylase RimI-like enzyme
MSIRKAVPDDASIAAVLMFNAFEDIAYKLTGAQNVDDVLAVLSQFFREESNRLSYRHVLVEEIDGKPVGLLIAYHGSDAARLDQPLLERLQRIHHDPSITIDQEANPDEFYIDTLSIAPEYGGRGIGTALLHAAEQWAASLSYHKLALNVDQNNELAYRLYHRLGYRIDKVRYLYQHPYNHMVKYLP